MAQAKLDHVIAKLESDSCNELHSILAMLELIGEGPLTETQCQYLAACRSSADRLLRSIQSIYQFVCGEEPGAAVLEAIDLEALVDSVTLLAGVAARRKGLHLHAEIRPGTPPRVAGDRRQIENALLRLMDNAIRFTTEGSVYLAVESGDGPAPAPGVNFVVGDSGPGIPTEVTARVIDPAVPLSPENGLGLPIVTRLVRRMGGKIAFEAAKPGGARVTVSLPLKPLPGPAPSTPAGTLPPLKILVAEDSDDSFYVIESYLKDQGHRLVRAADGVQALEAFKGDRYDMVLMDVHMPVMNGYQATHAIREWETSNGRARVPIIVLSSDSPQIQRQRGAQAGCSGYLTKPASKAAVLRTLERFSEPLV